MEYYAKSENSQGHQETVKEHLQKVAALAREYGEALGLADAAKLGAHVHDFGKYTKASQDVLKGTRTGVDHAISSACFLECCYKGSPGSCPVIQPYLPRCHRRVPPQLCPRFRVLRRGDPCVHTAPRAAFPGDELLRDIERRVLIPCTRLIELRQSAASTEKAGSYPVANSQFHTRRRLKFPDTECIIFCNFRLDHLDALLKLPLPLRCLRTNIQPIWQLCQRAARAERRRLFGTYLDLDALAAHCRERDKAAVFQRNRCRSSVR